MSGGGRIMQEVNGQVREILKDICEERKTLRNLERTYSREFKGVLKLFRAISDKNFRKKKMTLKKRIFSQQDVIEEKEDYLYDACWAPMDSTMQFLADVITEVEGVSYVYRKLDLEDETFWVMEVPSETKDLFNEPEETVGVIGREKLFKGLEGIDCDDSYELADFFERKNEKFIMVKDADVEDAEIALFEDMAVPRYLTTNFPYLSKICTDVVASKLEEPEVSNDDIYAKYLSDLRNSQATVRPAVMTKKQ